MEKLLLDVLTGDGDPEGRDLIPQMGSPLETKVRRARWSIYFPRPAQPGRSPGLWGTAYGCDRADNNRRMRVNLRGNVIDPRVPAQLCHGAGLKAKIQNFLEPYFLQPTSRDGNRWPDHAHIHPRMGFLCTGKGVAPGPGLVL